MSKALTSIGLVMLILAAHPQGPNEGFIMQSEGTQHLLEHPAPMYPPIAKAAHVQGTVLLHVSVDPAGRVTGVDAIGGPSMLKGAAVDAVKRWTYRPFEEGGKAHAVQVVVEMPFSLGTPGATEKSDQAISAAFFPKDTECRNASAAANWNQVVALCGEVVVLAERFPDPKLRQNEIRGAYQAYGVALMSQGDPKSALMQFEKAVAVANTSLTAQDAEYASAYLFQAIDEHLLRMPAEAQRDYLIAEDSYRKAIVSLPDMTKQYSYSLSQALAYHAMLEKQTGHPEQFDKLKEEALRLNPHAMDRLGGSV